MDIYTIQSRFLSPEVIRAYYFSLAGPIERRKILGKARSDLGLLLKSALCRRMGYIQSYAREKG